MTRAEDWAFPSPTWDGMMLIEYFAAKAMQALIANDDALNFLADPELLAKQACIVAKATIDELEKHYDN